MISKDPIAKPTIHLNGSGAKHLADAYAAAVEALHAAAEALQGAAPNARDYYPQGDDAFRQAALEHRARAIVLETVMGDLVSLYEHTAHGKVGT